MRALVTGGAGFLGSSLVDRLLAEGHAVDVVDDLSTGALANLTEARASGGSLSFHRLDVRSTDVVDLIARRRPDVVFHLAGAGVATSSIHDPVGDASLTLLGGLRVLEGARNAAVAKVVVGLSGADLYGRLESGQLAATETSRGALAAPHGASLRALLEELSLFREHDGLEFSALAFGAVYGPREPVARPISVRGLIEGLLEGGGVSIPGDGGATRDFVYVDDAVDALSRAASHGSGLLLNVATGSSTSLLRLLEIAARAGGVTTRPHFLPWPEGEVVASCLDPSRAAIHLGWRPWTTLEAGVAELAARLGETRPGRRTAAR